LFGWQYVLAWKFYLGQKDFNCPTLASGMWKWLIKTSYFFIDNNLVVYKVNCLKILTSM